MFISGRTWNHERFTCNCSLKLSLSLLSSGHRAGSKVVTKAQELFGDTLDIEETVVVVDARKDDSDGMTELKNVLKTRREEMIVSYDLNSVLNLQPYKFSFER